MNITSATSQNIHTIIYSDYFLFISLAVFVCSFNCHLDLDAKENKKRHDLVNVLSTVITITNVISSQRACSFSVVQPVAHDPSVVRQAHDALLQAQ